MDVGQDMLFEVGALSASVNRPEILEDLQAIQLPRRKRGSEEWSLRNLQAQYPKFFFALSGRLSINDFASGDSAPAHASTVRYIPTEFGCMPSFGGAFMAGGNSWSRLRHSTRFPGTSLRRRYFWRLGLGTATHPIIL